MVPWQYLYGICGTMYLGTGSTIHVRFSIIELVSTILFLPIILRIHFKWNLKSTQKHEGGTRKAGPLASGRFCGWKK